MSEPAPRWLGAHAAARRRRRPAARAAARSSVDGATARDRQIEPALARAHAPRPGCRSRRDGGDGWRVDAPARRRRWRRSPRWLRDAGLARPLARRAAGRRRRRRARGRARSSAASCACSASTTFAVHLVGFAADGRRLGAAARLRQGDRPGPLGHADGRPGRPPARRSRATLARETLGRGRARDRRRCSTLRRADRSPCAGRSPRATWSSTSTSSRRACPTALEPVNRDGEVERFECLRRRRCSSGSPPARSRSRRP